MSRIEGLATQHKLFQSRHYLVPVIFLPLFYNRFAQSVSILGGHVKEWES